MANNNNSVSSVYRCVIDDVITNVRGDFEDMGIEVTVLQELQRLWEHKVANARAANFVSEDGAYDEDEGDYEPTSTSLQYVPTPTDHAAAASLASLATSTAAMKPDPDASFNGAGKPQPFLAPTNQQPIRPSIPQMDGASDLTVHQIDALIEKALMEVRPSSAAIESSTTSPTEITLELATPEASLAAAQRALSGGLRSRQVDGNDDDEEAEGDEPINSDLDDTDDDEGIHDNGDDSGGDIILCMYEKVTRTKNKWKCVLKEGIMSLGGRDYVFQRANGDFEW